ncbi:branched-chain amino acid ABC transporter permease [Limibacillus sp. MBR-115]|jgi:branched-chain amino acid transport system permease protein|uniref:branched-chain amino acid ABC transporter permease n=1 Tax=Limibacillus sp. MBR-115 TaxID=3156465 RepID=UPI003390EFD3
MQELLGVPAAVLFGQLLLGLINGSFYALLSLGLAVIFGMLNVINFAHGALYMTGAFVAWMLLNYLGIGYWPALILVPIAVGALGVLMEKTMLSRLYKLDHLYGLLLTFGLALIIEGLFRNGYGVSGQPYPIPDVLSGGYNLGFMFLPIYRGWVIIASLIICFGTWFLVERTRFGAYLRAAVENQRLVRAFGINVPLLMTMAFGFAVALAGVAGVLAAPIYQVSPLMGQQVIIVVFAIVVIGGLGSIMGSIITGLGVGIIEGLTKTFYPEGSAVVVFVLMAIVLVLRPHGLFGRPRT